MATITYSSYFFSFLKKNWFQISLGILVIYAIFKKDLSLSVNLQSPTPIEQITIQKKKKTMTEVITTNTPKSEQLNIIPSENSI